MLALRFNTSALDEMFNLASDLDTLFTGQNGAAQRRSAWTPAVEVHETDDAVSMAVELPGVNPQDVHLSLQNGLLTITGEKAPAAQQGTNAVRYSERWYGRFERSFSLPSGVDAGRIDASYDAGILTIRLHKSEQARPREIQIKVGASTAPAQIGANQK